MAVFVVSVSCLFWAGAQGTLDARAAGVAAIRGDVGQARDEALRDALRRAVEQVMGTVVEGRTLMVDFAVVEDRVRGRSEGFVRSYDVVDERREDDLYRVEIEAVVSRQLIEDDLEGFGALLRSTLGNPRVVLLTEGERGSWFEDRITNYLVARSFFVIDPRQALAEASLDARTPPEARAELARSLDADLVVEATLDADATLARDTGENRFFQGRARATLRAVLANTAQVAVAVGRDAEAVATQEHDATDEAARDATEAVLGDFVLDVVSALNTSARDEGTLVSISVTVKGLPDFAAYQRVAGLLRATRGVSGVQARGFEEGTGRFDVQGTATSMDLASAADAASALPLEVSGFQDQSIELQWR